MKKFSGEIVKCPKCHFTVLTPTYCRGCNAHSWEHLHRSCICGYEWTEACADSTE